MWQEARPHSVGGWPRRQLGQQRLESEIRDAQDAGYVAILCGSNHSVALRDDGRLVCWGEVWGGERVDAPTDAGYIGLALGDHHSVALRTDGRVVTWGSNTQRERDGAPTDAGYVAIACGNHHSIAVRDDGRVVTWGSSQHGERDDSPQDLRASPFLRRSRRLADRRLRP
mmetsp:Transcript_27632/g.110664  ORF Transcript_27632/g.110664 Transcript_27632/m.110664 type:complete len:170 (-) Transcript_27632:326-835(-)